MTLHGDQITLATHVDVNGILALQEQNLADSRGSLSVAFAREWFVRAIAEMPVVIAREDDRIIGYVLSSPFAAQAHLPIVQAMLRAYAILAGSYLYGPICVAHDQRGRGLAGRLFAALRAQLPGRQATTFIRSDNAASLRAHAKMGLRQVAEFAHSGHVYMVMAESVGPEWMPDDVVSLQAITTTEPATLERPATPSRTSKMP
jgi:L-amino acid N-acyltransferase YncA